MNPVKFLVVVALICSVPVTLIACGVEPQPVTDSTPGGGALPPNVTTFPVTVNGKQVWCVWATASGSGGLSCDFNNERGEP